MGEADIIGWWGSHGLDDVGEYVLAELFPRTWKMAGAEVAVLAAAKRHADALPDRDDVVQLFGEPLPSFSQTLAWLAELKTGGDDSYLDDLRALKSPGDVAATVTALAPPSELDGEFIGGTLRLGTVSAGDLADPHTAEALAATLAAVYVKSSDDLIVPYFDLT